MPSDETQELFSPGDMLDGQYRILRLLGQGGMGAVYVAEQKELHRRVAIKVVHHHLTSSDAVQRLQHEARIMASVGHRSIVEIYDVRLINGVPYVVMELLDGHDLTHILNTRGRLEPEEAVAVILEALSGLAAVHERGIIHRDLKPDNIFIHQESDGDEVVKLLDFGISKDLDPDTNLSLTRTGTVLGTPNYMAPEQARGAGEIDQRVDVWAIGVVLYQAVTGRLPYEAVSYNELIALLLTKPYITPRRLCSAVPKDLEGVILKAMSRDPTQRYPNARSFHHALKKVADKHPSTRTPLLQGVPPADSVTRPFDLDGLDEKDHARFDSLDTMPFEAVPAHPSRRPRLLISLGATAAALVALIAIGAVVWPGAATAPVDEDTTTAPAPDRHVKTASGGESDVSPSDVSPSDISPTKAGVELPSEPERAIETVRLSFQSVPADTTIFVDDQAIEGSVAEVARADLAVKVAIKRHGRVVKQLELVPNENRQVSLASTRHSKRPEVSRDEPGERSAPSEPQAPEVTALAEGPPAAEPETSPPPEATPPTHQPAKIGRLPLETRFD